MPPILKALFIGSALGFFALGVYLLARGIRQWFREHRYRCEWMEEEEECMLPPVPPPSLPQPQPPTVPTDCLSAHMLGGCPEAKTCADCGSPEIYATLASNGRPDRKLCRKCFQLRCDGIKPEWEAINAQRRSQNHERT